MNVFGHNHVADQRALIFFPHREQNFEKQVPFASVAQKREPPITAARNEMQVPLAVTSFQFVTHRDDGYAAHPSRQRRMRQPQRQSQRQQTDTSTAVVVSSRFDLRQADQWNYRFTRNPRLVLAPISCTLIFSRRTHARLALSKSKSAPFRKRRMPPVNTQG